MQCSRGILLLRSCEMVHGGASSIWLSHIVVVAHVYVASIVLAGESRNYYIIILRLICGAFVEEGVRVFVAQDPIG